MGKPQNSSKDPSRDVCGTPPYAIEPLIPYLRPHNIVWESAAGEGLLADVLGRYVGTVICTDIVNGQNYFDDHVEPAHYTMQITNVPFSLKYEWLKRAYVLGKPFALLMPAETLFAATAQKLFDKYGFGMLLPSQRINFKMPNSGWRGQAQFTSAWFTWQLGVPEGVNIVKVDWVKQKRLIKNGQVAPIQPIRQKMRYEQMAMFAGGDEQ